MMTPAPHVYRACVSLSTVFSFFEMLTETREVSSKQAIILKTWPTSEKSEIVIS